MELLFRESVVKGCSRPFSPPVGGPSESPGSSRIRMYVDPGREAYRHAKKVLWPRRYYGIEL